MRKTLLLHCEDFYKINPQIKVTHMCIYDYMQGMFSSPNKKIVRKEKDDHQYTWIALQKIIDDMPYLGISNKEAMSRNIKFLIDLKIIDGFVDKTNNSKTYYKNGINSVSINNSIPTDSKVDTNRLNSRKPTDSKVVKQPTQKSNNISIKDNSIKDNKGEKTPLQSLTDIYSKGYNARFGNNPISSEYGIIKKVLDRLLKDRTHNQIEKAIYNYYKSDDPFVMKQGFKIVYLQGKIDVLTQAPMMKKGSSQNKSELEKWANG